MSNYSLVELQDATATLCAAFDEFSDLETHTDDNCCKLLRQMHKYLTTYFPTHQDCQKHQAQFDIVLLRSVKMRGITDLRDYVGKSIAQGLHPWIDKG